MHGVDVVVPVEPAARQVQAAALVVLLPAHHVVAHAERVLLGEADIALEVALMLVGRRGHDQAKRFGRGDDHLAALPAPLIAPEIEDAVLDERPADGAAKLLLVVRRLHRRQRRPGVPVAGSNHDERRAVHLVGAALGDHAGHARRVPAELGGELVGDELHFLDGLEREAARAELRRALQRQPLRVVVRAVDVGAEVPHLAAADVDRVRAWFPPRRRWSRASGDGSSCAP